MTFMRSFICFIVLTSFTISSMSCAGDRKLSLEYESPNMVTSLFSTVPSCKINVLDFNDKRADNVNANLIGFRTAAFNVQMGAVYSDVPVSDIIQQAIKSELIRSGHIVVKENEHITITGDILTYWVSTETTPLYWDVIGEVSILVKLKTTESEYFTDFGPYTGKAVKRTYLNPSKKIMERNLKTSLEKVIQTMSFDTQMTAYFENTEM